MKKTLIYFLTLCTVIILCICIAGAEEWHGRELEEVLNEWSGQLFVSEGEIKKEAYNICYMAPMWEEHVCLCGEKITDISVQFVSGDEAMKAVLDCGTDENGRQTLYLRFPEFPVPGEYVFHVAAASENHSFDRDYTLRIATLNIQLFRYKGNDTMYIAPGKEYTVTEVFSYFFELPPEFSETYPGSVRSESGGAGVLNVQNLGKRFLNHDRKLTGKLRFIVGNAELILNHVTFDSIANQGTDADGREDFPETQTELKDLPETELKRLDDLFSKGIFGTYYTSASLENVKTDGYSVAEEWGSFVRTIELAGEEAEYWSAELVSGDPFLKGALRFWKDPGTGHLTADVNDYISGQAGEAVFHLTLKSGHYRMEKDYKLEVVPFPENAFSPKAGGEIVIAPGKDYTVQDLAAMPGTLTPALTDKLYDLRFEKKGVLWCGSAAELVRLYQSEVRRELSGRLDLLCGNVLISIPKVKVKQGAGLFVIGPSAVCPGANVMYFVAHTKGKSSIPEDSILTAEGAAIDPEGRVRIGKEAKSGEQFVITASSEEAGQKTSLTVTVKDCTWTEPSWTEVTAYGVTLPIPYGVTAPEIPEPKHYEHDLKEGKKSAYDNINFRIGNLEGFVHYDVYVIPEKEIRMHNGDVEGTLLNWPKDKNYITDTGYMYINGSRTAYITDYQEFNKEYAVWNGEAVTVAGGYRIAVSYWLSGDVQDGILLFDKDFLMDALRKIRIDGMPVEIIDHEPAPELIQEDGITDTCSGATVRYSAGAADPVYGKVVWEITDLKGKAAKAATISNGVLKAGNVKKTEKVVVKVRYQNCLQTDSMELKIWPGVKKISLQASDDFLYLGSDDSLTLNVSGDPEGTKLIGLAWSMNKEGIAEMKDNGDGTVVMTPVTPGAVTVTVTEAAGKKAAAKITVTDKPVTSVEITMKGEAAPGKTVTLSAILTPDKPAKKDVAWSIDADGSIATIDAKGQLKIAKDAPAGTVIRVTCTALGAAQPIEATIDLTIE